MKKLNKLWNCEAICMLEDIPVYHVGENHLENVRNLEIQESDIIVYSTPKSGTHWLENIISHLVDGGKIGEVENVEEYFPVFHVSQPNGVDLFQALPGPRRLGRTHFPMEMVPQQTVIEGRGKVVYMARNPKDVLVSGSSFWKTFLDAFSGTFEDYFNLFVFQPEDLIFGDNIKHVQQWWSKRNDPNVSFVFYEDLKLDPFSEIKRLSEFLGCSHTDQEISEIVTKTDFKTQKSWGETKRCCKSTPLMKEFNFFRKGQVGDWVNHFTVAQNRIFDEVYRRRTEAMDDPVPFKFEIDD